MDYNEPMSASAAKNYKDLIWQDPDRVSGQPCFYGTRVPVRILFEFLEANAPLEEFLHSYPSVSREMAQEVLKLAENGLLKELEAA